MPTTEKSTPRGRSLEETARSIFGPDDPASIQRWVSYWQQGPARSAELLGSLEPLLPLEFEGRRVLDIGCGAGGLGRVIGDRCRLYAGADYHLHVLKFGRRTPRTGFVQCSGTELPFPSRTFDYVFAMDVIEHLVGGESWQLRFLEELRRVVRPLGMIFLSTPNRWYPYEGHTGQWGPQYLPRWLADRYLAWRNPGFLKEHGTFGEIRILGPRKLRRLLRQSRLCFLHELPCAMDRRDFVRHFPVRGALACLGLGWWLHAEFWGILVPAEKREQLRHKLCQNWFYEQRQPSPRTPRDFGAVIDFEQEYFNHQLGPGWYWHERDRRAFRWASSAASCYLQIRAGLRYLRVEGFCPRDNVLEVRAGGVRIGEKRLRGGQGFSLEYLIPFKENSDSILQVDLCCRDSLTLQSREAGDERELGVMIFSIGAYDELAHDEMEKRTIPG